METPLCFFPFVVLFRLSRFFVVAGGRRDHPPRLLRHPPRRGRCPPGDDNPLSCPPGPKNGSRDPEEAQAGREGQAALVELAPEPGTPSRSSSLFLLLLLLSENTASSPLSRE